MACLLQRAFSTVLTEQLREFTLLCTDANAICASVYSADVLLYGCSVLVELVYFIIFTDHLGTRSSSSSSQTPLRATGDASTVFLHPLQHYLSSAYCD
jgi:hypothetical protein